MGRSNRGRARAGQSAMDDGAARATRAARRAASTYHPATLPPRSSPQLGLSTARATRATRAARAATTARAAPAVLPPRSSPLFGMPAAPTALPPRPSPLSAAPTASAPLLPVRSTRSTRRSNRSTRSNRSAPSAMVCYSSSLHRPCLSLLTVSKLGVSPSAPAARLLALPRPRLTLSPAATAAAITLPGSRLTLSPAVTAPAITETSEALLRRLAEGVETLTAAALRQAVAAERQADATEGLRALMASALATGGVTNPRYDSANDDNDNY